MVGTSGSEGERVLQAAVNFCQRARRFGLAFSPNAHHCVLVDGRRMTRQVDNIPKFGRKPLSRPDNERKFRGNVGER